MKALIRKHGEDILEKDFGVLGIDHEMMARMCSGTWAGGAYRLVGDYAPEVYEATEGDIITAIVPVDEVPKVYHINGKTYTEDELRAMLNQ